MSVRCPNLNYRDLSTFERHSDMIRQRIDSFDLSINAQKGLDSRFHNFMTAHSSHQKEYKRDYIDQFNQELENTRRLEEELKQLKSSSIRNNESPKNLTAANTQIDRRLNLEKEENEAKHNEHSYKILESAFEELNEKYNVDVKNLHDQYNSLRHMYEGLKSSSYKDDKVWDNIRSMNEQVDFIISSLASKKVKKLTPKKTYTKRRTGSCASNLHNLSSGASCYTCAFRHKHDWAK